MANSLIISGTAIRQLDGLFSLNDLHWAAGGAEKHSPNRFLRIDQTQALIKEISNTPNLAFISKQKLGTYACRELVIAYAAWISPAFHLKVIRVFLDQTASPRHTTTPITAATGPAATGPAANLTNTYFLRKLWYSAGRCLVHTFERIPRPSDLRFFYAHRFLSLWSSGQEMQHPQGEYLSSSRTVTNHSTAYRLR